jgi:hypothetical protein
MEIFELITITLSFIVGLGVAQILASVVGVIRTRRIRKLHWLPLAWAASIFLAHVQFWFALYMRNAEVTWTWATFGPVLLLAVLVFLSGGLILPSEASQRSETLLDDFREHGRLALIPLAAYLLTYVPQQVSTVADLANPGNVADFVLAILIVIAYKSERPAAQTITYAAFAVIHAYATFFIWATPG